jgi:hypothetical protein
MMWVILDGLLYIMASVFLFIVMIAVIIAAAVYGTSWIAHSATNKPKVKHADR